MVQHRVRQAVVLAGGTGSRYRVLTEETPQALLPIANKPMLWYVLTFLLDSGVDEKIIIVARNEKERELIKKTCQEFFPPATLPSTSMIVTAYQQDGDEDDEEDKYDENDFGTWRSLLGVRHAMSSDLFYVLPCDLIGSTNLQHLADEMTAMKSVALNPIADPKDTPIASLILLPHEVSSVGGAGKGKAIGATAVQRSAAASNNKATAVVAVCSPPIESHEGDKGCEGQKSISRTAVKLRHLEAQEDEPIHIRLDALLNASNGHVSCHLLHDPHVYLLHKRIFDIPDIQNFISLKLEVLPYLARRFFIDGKWGGVRVILPTSTEQTTICERACTRQQYEALSKKIGLSTSEAATQDIPVSMRRPKSGVAKTEPKWRQKLINDNCIDLQSPPHAPTATTTPPLSSASSSCGIEDSWRVKGCMIGSNVSIGTGTSMSDSTIMDDAQIAENCMIKKCIIGKGSKIPPNARLTSCVIGSSVNLKEDDEGGCERIDEEIGLGEVMEFAT